jgi:hypothetical protein
VSRWPNLSQKRITFEMIGYSPYPEQLPPHESAAEVLQTVGAEGAGKSSVAAAEITACVPWSKLIYLVGQTYDNTHPEFNYLVEHLLKLGALDLSCVSQPRMGAWRLVTRTGCTIVTLSAERGASAIIAKGEQPDIICLTEAGIIESYSVFLAAVRRATRSRGRVIIVGTLKDNFGWYAALVDELTPPGNAWRGETFSLPAWINLQLYPGGRNDPEIKRLEAILPPDEFQRTVAARRVPSRALVFPEFSYADHVRPCPYDAGLPVHIWIDPGYQPSVYAVIPVQFHGSEVWQIDEVYLNDHTHSEVINVCQGREWWQSVRRAVIDFAGRQHHADRSATEVWEHEAGHRPHSQQVGILDGIMRHRDFLHNKRLFHDPGCKHTLEEYKKYRRKTDRDGNPTSEEPIDAHNHLMKALAYGLVDKFGFVDNRQGPPPVFNYVKQQRGKRYAGQSQY